MGRDSNEKRKNDIKIFILYLMRHTGYPLRYGDIYEVTVDNGKEGFAGHFDFIECFGELLEMGNIAEGHSEDGEELYSITEQGRVVEETLETDLKPKIHDRSLKAALQLLSFRRRGTDVACFSEPMDDGRHMLTCRITEGGEPMLNIRIIAENTIELEKMKSNFVQKPETCYRGILALLSGEVNYLLQ